jgi:hypothetical protein
MKSLVFLILAGTLVLNSGNPPGIFEETTDVGGCKLAGSTAYDPAEDVYTITGAGQNIWARADEFHFAWLKINGDFSMSARIAFEGEGVVAHRKMGIMLRETLDGDSPYADVVVHGDGLTSLQYRLTKGDITNEIKSEITGADHIVLERSGDQISIKTAIGEKPIDLSGSAEISLPETCYLGIFMCSHDENVIEKGYFYDLELQEK